MKLLMLVFTCASIVTSSFAMEEDSNIFDSAFCREFKKLHDSYTAEIQRTKLKRKEGRLAYVNKKLNAHQQARMLELDRLEPSVDIFAKVKKISGQLQNYKFIKSCVETSGEFAHITDVYHLYRALKCNKDRRGKSTGIPILHRAIINKKIDIVILLLAVGAFFGYDYATEKTALTIACEVEDRSVIALLLYAHCIFNNIATKDFLQEHQGKSIMEMADCVRRDQYKEEKKRRSLLYGY